MRIDVEDKVMLETTKVYKICDILKETQAEDDDFNDVWCNMIDNGGSLGVDLKDVEISK